MPVAAWLVVSILGAVGRGVRDPAAMGDGARAL
jgi:hypothetical protein